MTQLPQASARNVPVSPRVRALARAVTVDIEDGFWKVTHVQPGRGFSSVTHAEHIFENGVRLQHRYYTPGPFDTLAYGAEHKLATSRSTYSVYCAISGQPDELSQEAALELIRALHANVDEEALGCGTSMVWSPDGEGDLFMEFADEDVEAAIRFAQTLNPVLQTND